LWTPLTGHRILPFQPLWTYASMEMRHAVV
jgi:hypothetical protein